jgi:type I restriction enzyme, R subunit
LLDGMAGKGFDGQQLAEISRIINAENSDVYDVLAYIAFALAPIARSEARRSEIFSHYESLGQYVKQGVGELEQEKLPSLLQLKYHTVDDALVQLGTAAAVRDAFVGFQQYLYSDRK